MYTTNKAHDLEEQNKCAFCEFIDKLKNIQALLRNKAIACANRAVGKIKGTMTENHVIN